MKAQIRQDEVVNADIKGRELRIMTYNMLAQSLVRREQYPTNGNSIKWATRFPTLVEEIFTYNPDIACFQEVDYAKIEVWTAEFAKHGMNVVYNKGTNKAHGLLMAFNNSKFELVHEQLIRYDEVELPPKQVVTGNIGCVLVLKDLVSQNHIVVGTTHMYWHPNACYERGRQICLLGNLLVETKQNFNASSVILAGDFNSSPESPGCKFIRNSLKFDDIDCQKIIKSASTDFFGAVGALPDQLSPTLLADKQACVDKLLSFSTTVQSLHLNSCYSFSIPFTNWTDDFKDCIDYIYISDDLAAKSVLRLPTLEELGPEPNSIPRSRDSYGFPSDHIPLVSTVVVK